MKTLKDVRIGEVAIIRKIHGEGATRRRMLDMGMTEGTALSVMKVAPLGDPVEVRVRNSELSFRKADAELIEIE